MNTVLFVLREAGGETVIFTYAVYLFKQANCPIDPFTSTIIVGVLRIICTLTGSKLMDKMGRRPLLLASSFFCALSVAIAGGIHIANIINEASKWTTVVCIYIFVASYGLGLGPILWGLSGELTPSPIRTVGCSIIFTAFGASAFLFSNCFIDMVTAFGLGGALVFFSGAIVLLIIVAAIWLPETKGKTLLEIETLFASQSSNVVSNA